MSNYSLEKKKEELKNDTSVPEKSYRIRIYSDDEIEEILKGYIELKRPSWSLVRTNTKICYYLKQEDGSELFRFGGYVNASFSDKEETNHYINLRGNIRKNLKSNIRWTINLDKVSRLYMQMSPEYQFVTTSLEGSTRKLRLETSDAVNKLVDIIRNLKKRIKSLELQLNSDTASSAGTAITHVNLRKNEEL